jgi:hypothetical protein
MYNMSSLQLIKLKMDLLIANKNGKQYTTGRRD